MKLATFNIYWLGGGGDVVRTAQDNKRLADIIAKLDADVFVFQEIVDPDVLREILDMADELTSRSYTMHDAQDRLLGLGGGAQAQKVVAAYDAEKFELLAASPIFGGNGRLPFGLRLRRKADGAQVLVVGVHFQSGYPNFTDADDAEKRRRQCQHLADWVAGAKASVNPTLPMPQNGEHIAVLGDFNALYDSNNSAYAGVVASLDPLRTGHMADWWWKKPLRDAGGGDRTTSYLEHLLIDFVMLSPSLKERIAQRPTIYAFDQDPTIGASGISISDHRPVFVEIDISPS